MGMLGVTFRARARGRNAADEVIPGSAGEIVWSTDTPDILDVTPEGDVTSVGEGQGRVIARLAGAEATMRVPVREVARLAWQASLGGFVGVNGPTVGPEGTVYASSGARFWAFEPRGAVRWSVSTSEVYSVPAVRPDGTLYIGSLRSLGSTEAEVSAISADGATLWRFSSPESFRFPVLGPDGRLFAMQRDGDAVILRAVDAETGGAIWEHRTNPETPAFPMPTLGSEGALYFTSADGTLWTVSTGGEPLWSTRPGGPLSFVVSPVVAADGTIYLGSMDHRLYALSPEDGSVRWSLDLGYEIMASPALGADGTIYQTAGPVLYAISPGGGVLWSWRMDAVSLTSASPVVSGDGTVYVGASNGVFAIDGDGQLSWDFGTHGPVWAAPAIGLDGTVYVAASDSTLYAIRELDGGNGGFDASPWPVWRGNRQNTGRAGP